MSSPPRPIPPADDGRSRWIENDALLRDEAVLFGWAGPEDVAAKADAIRSYYLQRGEAAESERLRLDAVVSGADERIGELEQELADGAASGATPVSAYPLLRCAVGIALGVLICAFNLYVVYELMGGAREGGNASPFTNPLAVALGVTLLGMFTVFAPVSILYRRDTDTAPDRDPEPAKVWVAELAPPIAAAFFTVVWGHEPSLLHTVASFFFVLALFVFAGKMLLSLIPHSIEAAREWRAGEALAARRAALLSECERQRAARAAAREALGSLPSAQDLAGRAKFKVDLFLCEVRFARMATRHLAAVGGDVIPQPVAEVA